MHVCYLCGEERPDRAVWHEGGVSRVRLPQRFEGPEGTANGGITAGVLGCVALHAASDPALAIYRVRARFERQIPLHRDIEGIAQRSDDGAWQASLVADGRTYATARVELGPAESATWEPVPNAFEDAVARMAAHSDVTPSGPRFVDFRRDRSSLPVTCFGCALPRSEGGLYIPGQRVGEGVVSSFLEFDDEFDEGDGTLANAIGAAATDCSTRLGFHTIDGFWDDLIERDLIAIAGTLDYRWLRPVPLDGRDYRVLGTPNGTEGRKLFGVAALFDTDGELFVLSEGTWLTVPNPYT